MVCSGFKPWFVGLLLSIVMAGSSWADELDDLFGTDADEQAQIQEETAPKKEPELPVIPLAEEEVPELEPSRKAPVVLEEIVVTATKRAKSVRDIPTSIDAYSGDDLEEQGATGFEDYLKFSPGVSFNPTSPDRGNISIRGVTTDTATNLTSVPTGLFLDEVPLANPSLAVSRPNPDPFDMASIEVLKGPQGTLFGGSALAGALRAVPNAPDPSGFAGKLFINRGWVSQSQGQGEDYGIMLNAPLGEAIALRVAATQRDWPGVIDDTRRDLDDVDKNSVQQQRAMLGFWPTDALSLQLMYQGFDVSTEDVTFADNPDSFTRNTTPGPSPLRSKVEIGGLKAQYDFEHFSLISATNVLDKSRLHQLDVNRVVNLNDIGDIGVQFTIGFTDTITQELRLVSADGDDPLWSWLAGWDWLIGLFYMDSDQAVLTDIAAQLQPNPDLGPLSPVGEILDPVLAASLGSLNEALGPQTLLDTEARAKAEELALFMDVTGALGEQFELNIGLRLFEQKNAAHAISRTGGVENLNETGNTRETGLNPKLALTWHANEQIRLIAGAAKGFRFGGVNGIIGPNINDVPPFYQSDELWNYEISLRTDWFGGAMRADLTAFLIEWERLQITQRASDGLNQFIDNVGGSKNQGLEAQFTSVLPWGFLLNLNGAYVDARTTVEFESAQGTVAPDTRLPATPYQKWSASLGWGGALAGVGLNARVSIAHQGSSYNNLAKEVLLPAYETVDASLNLLFERWDFTPKLGLNVRNLLDERAATNIVANAGTDSFTDYYFVRPRMVTLQLGLEF